MISALQQGTGSPAPPTVGDTLWFSRTIPLPAGATVRPLLWDSGGTIESLGAPQVLLRGDSAVIRYPAVAWRPGALTLRIPGPVLLAADGRLDSLAPATFNVQVASVLPRGVAESTLAIQPPAGVVARTTTSIIPVVLALLLAAALLLPRHLWWRRRGKQFPPRAAPPIPVMPVEQWAANGETRAVASAAAARLRQAVAANAPEIPAGLEPDALASRIEELRPDWPADQIADLLRAIDHSRFTPGPVADSVGLYRRADELASRLAGAES
jgi:hypothetical protein